ncbi:APC family permease, partial [Xylella fastidiosa subsp. multiplex]|nr:APC family permease [Xylella fastidiosa subsp. multiplex]
MSGYESLISQLIAAVAGRGIVYDVSIGSVIAVLIFSANTGFADFPRTCQILARDNFLPHAFAERGRRLVFSYGILV